MNRWLSAAIILACGSSLAGASSSPALRIGVLGFRAAGMPVSGAAAGALFSAALYRNFPGLAVADSAELAQAQGLLGLDAVVNGSIIAFEKDADGSGGTLMMSANLVKLSSGEILWADTRTARVNTPFLKRSWRKGGTPNADGDSVLVGELLELAVFKLVQDLGKRLPQEALVPTGERVGPRESEKQRCAPPAFYESLPRDREWYYGVGKSSDTANARDAAVENLAKQVRGDLFAGSAPLVGWEQDDSRRCDGVSYVLVRIEKEQAQKSINDSAIFSAAALPPLVDKTPSALALKEIARANIARTAMIYSDLFGPRKLCGEDGCGGVPSPEERIEIAAARRKLAADAITVEDVVQVSNIYLRHSDEAGERDFFNAVLYKRRPPAGPLAEKFELTRELVFPLAWSAAFKRKDWPSYFTYCGNYLRSYPDGIYAATAETNRKNAARVLMQRNDELALNGPRQNSDE